ADRMTGSMERAIAETNRRREKQVEYNTEHGITPESVKRDIKEIMASPYESREMDRLTAPGVKEDARPFVGTNFQAALKDLEGRMRNAAANLEFEEAARLRDEIKKMKLLDLEFANDLMTGAGEEVDKSAPKRWRAEAAAEKAEAFRKGKF
ncbi:excinuclease ABC subunit UvrB, partial [bacterium]